MDPLADLLTDRFTAARPRLRAIAVRMVGADADAALDEARRRLAAEDADAWLAAFVARVCLDRLRGRLGAETAGGAPAADSLGLAVMVVLETLAADERLAFVLRELFAVGYGEIAAVLGVGEGEARALAERARRRVRG
ncbi:sigma factor-like helix-turn-helix DNA-binding protein [Phytomonospora endophytica]|uniref:DNA-directed RNA polymerase specialized sigma24 family protein n=1 Tax=Phytomonospora endophytica TaxID=714109 RepID=A0A841FYQ7_9ACTN|nr:sigma factor-like helix-turn-helix DNA-binding protein [Phytomonospora endophytica]MBB6037569.1 DNA-directed RNA polymerase specialized sigma24 family protein [Phytomonospora endophytica]GIG70270.1 hypothetical protein Pen01_65650 [Phytomonospora endophytica]